MTNQIKRGEVWLANLNPTQGSEQAKDAIARLDATICAIGDSPHPSIPTFAPHPIDYDLAKTYYFRSLKP